MKPSKPKKRAHRIKDLVAADTPIRGGSVPTTINPNVMKKIDSTQSTVVQNLKG